MLRQKTEARMVMGSGFPNEFASALRKKHAGLTENGKTMVLASLGRTLAFPQVSSQMRRVWTLWVCLATGCPRGAGFGHGVGG